MNKKYLIIYHREDNDGVISGAMMYNFIKDNNSNVDIDTIGADYNQLRIYTETDIDSWREKYDKLILLDISFNNVMLMKYIYDTFGQDFTWVDHHKPIIDESFKRGFSNANGLRDIKNCTIFNLYKYLYDFMGSHNDVSTIPLLWRILSAWDSWTYEREGFVKDYVYAINKGVVTVYELDLEKCMNLVRHVNKIFNTPDEEKFINNLLGTGDTIVKYENDNHKRIIEQYGDYTFTVNGRKAVVLFMQGGSNSMMFVGNVTDDILNGAVFKRNPNTTWSMSLYNIKEHDDFHCGEYLKKKYNGGGHAGAGGCTMSEKQFFKILETKKI